MAENRAEIETREGAEHQLLAEVDEFWAARAATASRPAGLIDAVGGSDKDEVAVTATGRSEFACPASFSCPPAAELWWAECKGDFNSG